MPLACMVHQQRRRYNLLAQSVVWSILRLICPNEVWLPSHQVPLEEHRPLSHILDWLSVTKDQSEPILD